jgi:hypothetical protein
LFSCSGIISKRKFEIYPSGRRVRKEESVRVTVEVRWRIARHGVRQAAEARPGRVDVPGERLAHRPGEALAGDREEERADGHAREPAEAKNGQIEDQPPAEEGDGPVSGAPALGGGMDPIDRRDERAAPKRRSEAMGLAGKEGVGQGMGTDPVDPGVLGQAGRVAELGLVDDGRGGDAREAEEIAK